LSTDKYRRLVTLAKSSGFEICVIYVYVDALDTQLERIRMRVLKGGHDVPVAKVADRRIRSFDQFPWFFGHADRAWIYDNSRAEPQLVVHKELNRTRVSSALLPALRDRLFPIQQKQ
jgi:predicted ABC-type ATPase